MQITKINQFTIDYFFTKNPNIVSRIVLNDYQKQYLNQAELIEILNQEQVTGFKEDMMFYKEHSSNIYFKITKTLKLFINVFAEKGIVLQLNKKELQSQLMMKAIQNLSK